MLKKGSAKRAKRDISDEDDDDIDYDEEEDASMDFEEVKRRF
jgi:hypothetical protein